MKRRNIVLLIVCYVFILTGMLSGCTPGTGDENNNESKLVQTDDYQIDGKPGYKYEPVLQLSTCVFYGPQVQFVKGEDISNNIWTRAYKDYVGVDLNYTLISTDFKDFDTKIGLALTTNSLPDLIPVYTTLYFKCAEAGRLADLTESYNQYASEGIRTDMEVKAGGIAKKTCTIDEKLYAIASPPEPQGAALWIRQDWLDKLNVSWPKNIDETYNLMKKFKDTNPAKTDYPYALAFDRTLTDLIPFANAYGAYTGIWVDDGNGGLKRGETDEAWIPVLKKLNDLYNKKYIDPDFSSIQGSDLESYYSNEQVGIAFGTSSMADGKLNSSVEANKDARWKHDIITDKDGNGALMQMATRIGGFQAVNKDCTYPEALVLLCDVYAPLYFGPKQDYHDFTGKDGLHYDSFFYPTFTGGVPMGYKVESQQLITEAINTNNFTKLNGEQLGYYKRMKPWLDNKKPIGWRMWAIFGPEGAVLTDKKIVENSYLYPDRGWGPETEGWVKKGPTLASKVTDNFGLLIKGKLGSSIEDGFKKWQEEFNNNGGIQATQEINDWWKSTGRTVFDDYYGKHLEKQEVIPQSK